MKILWTGSLSDPTGYGQASRLLVRGLRKYADITCINKTFTGNHSGPILDEFKDLLEKPKDVQFDIHTQAYTPEFFNQSPNSKKNIGLTMFETDSIPAHWKRYMMPMDNIITPTEWGASIFSNYIPKDKIIVSPLGYDKTKLCETDYGDLKRQIIEGKEDRRIVLCCCDYNIRKGIKEIFKAVNMAPDNLFFILRFAPVQASSNAIVEDVHMHIYRDNYAIIPHFITDENIANLMYISDFIFSPTRGEGFGLPLIESMAHGTPVVATNWSAHTSFVNNENGFLIDYLLDDIDPGDMITGSMLYYGHKWSIVTKDGISRALDFMSTISNEQLTILKNKAREDARKYECDTIAKKLYDSLEKSLVT